MKKNILYDFWKHHVDYGFHPDDRKAIQEAGDVVNDWTFSKAIKSKSSFDADVSLHRKIHKNLFPQPFSGDLNTAKIFLLYGNPGFTIDDYTDNYKQPAYINLCRENLRGELGSLTCLHPDVKELGLGKYWRPRLQKLANEFHELPERTGKTFDSSLAEIAKSIAVIEAGAYQSRSTPGEWFFNLPSSLAARDFVQNDLKKMAENGDCLIISWRKSKFWSLDSKNNSIIIRKNSRLSYLEISERKAILERLAKK